MTPEFYLGDGRELHVERRAGVRRTRNYGILGAALVLSLAVNLLQAWQHAKHRAAAAEKVTIEHRIASSQRDEEIGSLYDPENRWLCKHTPAVRM